MKNTLIIFLTVVAIVSCKGSTTRNNAGTSDENSSLGGLTLPGIKNFTPAEIEIGRRICTGITYKQKKMNQLADMAEKFAFTGTWKSCGSQAPAELAQYTASISNSTAELRYVPSSPLLHSIPDVVTDLNEPLKTLCTNIPVSNAVSNLVQFGGANYYFKLYNINGYDTYELAKRSKNVKGAYALASTQSVSIITTIAKDYTQSSAGIEKFRTLNTPCPAGSDYTSTSHTWITATTPYKLPTE